MAQASQIEAAQIIEMLEAEVGSRTAPDGINSGLVWTLKQLPLATLLGFVASKCNGTHLEISLKMEVEALRDRLQDSA